MKAWRTVPASLALIGTLALPLAPARAEDEPQVLAPSSPWVMDYADESCALRREFGGPDNPVILQIQQFVPDSSMFSVQVYGPQLEYRIRSVDRLQLRFLPDESSWGIDRILRVSAEDLGRGVAFHATLTEPQDPAPVIDPGAPITPEVVAARIVREQQIIGIELGGAFTQDLRLDTRSLGNPMQGMRNCLDELLTHWGIDVVAHRTLQRRVEPVDQPR